MARLLIRTLSNLCLNKKIGGKIMGKDLNGRELGTGFSQRADGLYCARKQINKESICLYNTNYEHLKREFKKAIEDLMQKQLQPYIPQNEQTLNEWFEFWYEYYKRPFIKETCWKSYKRQFVNSFGKEIGEMLLSQILQMHVQRAIVDLMDEGRSSGTIKDSLSILRQCLEVAEANGLITTNPAKGLQIKENQTVDWRVLTNAEEIFFLETIESRNDWYKEMYQYILSSGIRIGEAGALKTQDIDFLGEKVYIRHTLFVEYDEHKKTIKLEPTKNEKTRIIPFFGETASILRRQLKKRDELKKRLGENWRSPEYLGDLVFVTGQGSPVARHNAEERLRTLSKQLNEIQMIRALEEGRVPVEFKPISPHDLRHTFATRLLEKGMPIQVICQLLGHADIKTTQLYAHVLDDTLTREVQKIGDILKLE